MNIKLFLQHYILLSNTNDLEQLDKHTQTLIWGGVIGVSILFIVVFLAIHFFYWQKKNNQRHSQRLGVNREHGVLFEIRRNIFLILTSLFAISLVVGIITIVKLNV
ncbi:hypothetical protein [Spiroplasma sp. SV19]|uniref:hypothetical protein n=1 Tax=Spiroplasma sp. SV19 TaxID=2570468 RepID=UPI0024B64D43|nr:hypothetical protein [Spiroplasma sp. SV19]WHQ36609.1 hypothetical protein E7Y35_01535 [Spiroplasma sp. SV19]